MALLIQGIWATNKDAEYFNGSLYNPGNTPKTTVFASYDDWYGRQYGTDRTITFSAQCNVTGGYGNGTSSASATITVPARSYQAPRPPKSLAVARVSDASQKVFSPPSERLRASGVAGDAPLGN